MQVAQRLYEQGWITYMRTDSTTLSDEALSAARTQAAELYGQDYVPASPRRYERKVKNAQEAHEAIRPAGEVFRTPDQAAQALSGDMLRLYDLVWKRTVASQMADATGTSAQVRLVGTPEAPAAPGGDDGDGGRRNSRRRERSSASPASCAPTSRAPTTPRPNWPSARCSCPPWWRATPPPPPPSRRAAHTTQPPARYTEASLVKALEELGVGRPSTYASILGTIQNRGYVWKKGTALVPSFTAFAVVGLLERYFGDLVDYGFTAAMENDLDDIAGGQQEALPWLTRFYFGGTGVPAAPGATAPAPSPATQTAGEGNGTGDNAAPRSGNGTGRRGLKENVASHLGEIDAREVNSIPIGVDDEGEPIVVRVGRYGPYLQRGEDRGGVPEDLAPDELTVAQRPGAAGRPVGGPVARHRSRQHPRGVRAVGPVRPLRAARAGGRRRRASPHGVAVPDHDA